MKNVGSLMLVTGELSRALSTNKHGRDVVLDLVVLKTPLSQLIFIFAAAFAPLYCFASKIPTIIEAK